MGAWGPSPQMSGAQRQMWGVVSYLTPLFPSSFGGKLKAMSQFHGLNTDWNYRPQVTSFLCPQPGPKPLPPQAIQMPALATFSQCDPEQITSLLLFPRVKWR